MKNKLILLFLFWLLLFSKVTYSQILGENNALFSAEITDLLLKASKENISEILLKGNSFWNRYERKAVCRGNTNFIFENDTLITQKYQKEKYVFKIKNNEIIDLNIYSSDYKYLRTVIDSLNYKIYTSISINKNNDSSLYLLRTKYDELQKVVEETITDKDSINFKQYVTRYQYEGDTIKYIQHYEEAINGLKLTGEEKNIIRYSANKINYIISYKKSPKDINWLKDRMTYYFYDSKNTLRITRIEKYDFLGNENEWIEKHILTIKYKANNKH